MKQQYKEMKPEMGVFIIRSKASNKCFLQATPNLRGTVNGTQFKLNAGIHPNRELQQDWNSLNMIKMKPRLITRMNWKFSGCFGKKNC